MLPSQSLWPTRAGGAVDVSTCGRRLMPCPRRRRSFRHRRYADQSTAILTPSQARCHSLASTALTTTLTAALALAPSTWAPRRRRRRRGDVRSNNGPARMGNAEIGTVPDAPGPMDTGSVATEVGVRGNLRSTQLLSLYRDAVSLRERLGSERAVQVIYQKSRALAATCAPGPVPMGHGRPGTVSISACPGRTGPLFDQTSP